MRDSDFVSHVNRNELNVRNSFKYVVNNFLGKHKASNYRELVNKMLSALEKRGDNMSIKVHFIFSHFDRFLKIWVITVKAERKIPPRHQQL